jgi:hypothetical protein
MTLSYNDLLIVGKYFNDINDFINLSKTNKNNNIFDLYHYNPIPLNTNTIKLFPNIETYHKYDNIFSRTFNFKNIVDWITPINYDEINEDENITYKCLYYKPENIKDLENIKIPDEVNLLIDENFKDCTNLTEIIISNNIKEIGKYCFHNCTNLSNIIIPTSVNELGKFCFWKCSNLSEINIPTSVKEIGYECFMECSNLTNIIIPISITKIGNDCFKNCINLTKIDILTDVKEINKLFF